MLVLLYAWRKKFNFFRKVSLVFSGDFEHIPSTRTLLAVFLHEFQIKSFGNNNTINTKKKNNRKISKSKLSYHQMDNIGSYLRACQDSLGMATVDLFVTKDLFESDNLGNVLKTKTKNNIVFSLFFPFCFSLSRSFFFFVHVLYV